MPWAHAASSHPSHFLSSPGPPSPQNLSAHPPLIYIRAPCPDPPPCPHPLSRLCPPGSYSSPGSLTECPFPEMVCPSWVRAPYSLLPQHTIPCHSTQPLHCNDLLDAGLPHWTKSSITAGIRPASSLLDSQHQSAMADMDGQMDNTPQEVYSQAQKGKVNG